MVNRVSHETDRVQPGSNDHHCVFSQDRMKARFTEALVSGVPNKVASVRPYFFMWLGFDLQTPPCCHMMKIKASADSV